MKSVQQSFPTPPISLTASHPLLCPQLCSNTVPVNPLNGCTNNLQVVQQHNFPMLPWLPPVRFTPPICNSLLPSTLPVSGQITRPQHPTHLPLLSDNFQTLAPSSSHKMVSRSVLPMDSDIKVTSTGVPVPLQIQILHTHKNGTTNVTPLVTSSPQPLHMVWPHGTSPTFSYPPRN